MAGTIVSSVSIKREKGFLYFVDKGGNVRKVKAKVGGTKGRKSCSTAAAKKKTTTAKPKRTAEGINKTTGRLKKGYKYGASGRVVKAKAATATKAKKTTAKKTGVKKAEGINQKTGQLKMGFKYAKGGRVVKAKAAK